MSYVADFFQEYLNMEIINLYIKTSESEELATKRLESIGFRIGEKITETFHFSYFSNLFYNLM